MTTAVLAQVAQVHRLFLWRALQEGMETLSIIGGGHLGTSMGLLWRRRGLVEIHGVLNRTVESARAAVEVLGQGEAIGDVRDLTPTDYVMLSVPDDAIAGCCEALAASRVLRPGTVVFHCSGSLPSSVLQPAKDCGARIASLHPIKSFADPIRCAETFPGTPCGIEGDSMACEKLSKLVTGCGGKVLLINPESKLLYHAGTVMVCNYLTALIEAGLRCYEAAGIPRQQAMELALPIIEETVQNNVRLGTAKALTGPIARGDVQLVRRQSEAVAGWDPLMAQVYKAMGLVAVELSSAKGCAPKESLEGIVDCLRTPH